MVAVLLLSLAAQATASADVVLPRTWLVGEPYEASVHYLGAEGGSQLETWRLGPAAFLVDGQPLAPRATEGRVPLAAGDALELRLDLGPYLPRRAHLELALEGAPRRTVPVEVFEPLEEAPDFMGLPAERLAGYGVLLGTNRGPMVFELWPDVAPHHVRNFLDLVSGGFYDGTRFHRVSPTFMIQGGCPNTRTDNRSAWGLGSGPRTVELELSDRGHERGVLSMARGPGSQPASCQFFVVTGPSPQLDGSYSTFGRLLHGADALDRIAGAPGRLREGTIAPHEPQRLERAIVVRRPEEVSADPSGSRSDPTQ